MTNLRDLIIDHTIDEFEGGESNHKADRGGLTKYGITKKFYAAHMGLKTQQVTNDMIKNLTKNKAATLYRKEWTAVRADRIPDEAKHIFFDMVINHGQGNATKIAQQAVGVKADGVIGPKTVKALGEHPDLINVVVAQRIKFYEAIVNKDPTQKVFLKGWKNRANWFLKNKLTVDEIVVDNGPAKGLSIWERILAFFK